MHFSNVLWSALIFIIFKTDFYPLRGTLNPLTPMSDKTAFLLTISMQY